MRAKAPVVTITMERSYVSAFCVCGWDWTRRRHPSGPGHDLPARTNPELQVAAETLAEKHLRTHLRRA